MYDRVKIWVDRVIVGGDFSAIPGYLDPDTVKSVYDYKTGQERTMGKLEGLRVSVRNSGLFIDGSLAKFYYGDNIHTLTRATTEEAIQKLGDLIHADMTWAEVKKFEFGTNFSMRYEVARYLALLGVLPKMQQGNFAGSVYYEPKGDEKYQRICFYDKRAEATNKKVTLPAGLGDNLLRYEIRFNGRLPKQLKWGKVYASTLYDSAFYRRVVEEWQDMYFSIEKKRQIKINAMSERMTVGEAVNLLTAQLISQADNTTVEAFINELRANNALKGSRDYTRLRGKIQDICTNEKTTETDDLIKELDDEVRNAGAYI